MNVIIIDIKRDVVDVGTADNLNYFAPGRCTIEAIADVVKSGTYVEIKVTTDEPIDSFKEAEAFIGNLFEGADAN